MAAGHGLTHWYPTTFYVLLPLIGKELGLSYTDIGFIMTVQHAAGAISNIPGGMLVDMVGKKGYLMALSLFWVGFPYALMSVTHSYWMLIACVVLVGIGNNIWHPAVIPTLGHNYPERKGLVLSFHGMGGNVGEAIAPFVVGALLAWYSWRAVVVINVVPGLIMSILILRFLGAFAVEKERDAAHIGDAKSYLRGFAELLRNKPMMLMAISNAFRIMTQSGLLTFLPLYLAYQLGYSPFAVGLCMMVVQVAGFIAGPIGGHLSDVMGRKRVIMSSMGLTALVIVGMVVAGKSALFIVFIALAGFFLYGTRPVLQAWVLEVTPKQLAGSAIGLQFGVGTIGSAISPALCGMIADAYDIFTAFYFLAATIVIANLLVFFLPDTRATAGESRSPVAQTAD
jgi:MFS family permease